MALAELPKPRLYFTNFALPDTLKTYSSPRDRSFAALTKQFNLIDDVGNKLGVSLRWHCGRSAYCTNDHGRREEEITS